MTVKRFDFEKEYSLDINIIPVEESDGAFVHYDDYAALQQKLAAVTEQRDALVAEMSHLWGFCKNAAFDADYEAELGMERGGFTDALNDIRTPAHDAAIAALRAEGAHFVANRMLAAWDAGFIEDTAKNAADIARMILTSTEFMADAPIGDFERSFADEMLKAITDQVRSQSEQIKGDK